MTCPLRLVQPWTSTSTLAPCSKAWLCSGMERNREAQQVDYQACLVWRLQLGCLLQLCAECWERQPLQRGAVDEAEPLEVLGLQLHILQGTTMTCNSAIEVSTSPPPAPRHAAAQAHGSWDHAKRLPCSWEYQIASALL